MKIFRGGKLGAVLAGLTIALGIGSSALGSITFTGSSGNLAASVTFDVSASGTLTVTLINTSMSDVLVPSDVLTAVFFDTASGVTLTRVSAVLAAGSSVEFGSAGPDGVVGGEWAYRSGLTAANRAARGISSTGLGLFGPSDLFSGSNLQGPISPDGLQYGITSLGDNVATGNAAVIGGNALIKNAVIFTFTGASGLDDSSFSHVTFQYGTILTDPSYAGHPPGGEPPAVPEAPTLIAGALLLLPFAASTYRILRRRKRLE